MNRLRLSRSRCTAVAVVLALVGGVPLVLAAPAQAATGYVLGATFTAGDQLAEVAVDPSTNTVYATDYADNVVRAFDGDTGVVEATVTVGTGPLGIAVDPGAHRAYVANYADVSVSVLDTTSNSVVATVAVSASPDGVAVDPSTHRVYVTHDLGQLDVIDGDTNTVVGDTTLGADPEGVAVDPSTHTVYAANRYSNSVSVVDGATLAVLATLPTGQQPRFVAVDPSTHRAYVTNAGSNTMTVVDGTTHTVVDTVTVDFIPEGVAVDPSTHTVYVAAFPGHPAVTVVDGTADAVVAHVEVAQLPYGVAVDPSTHRAYVATFNTQVYRIDSGPVPAVTSVSPSFGLPTGGQSVTVTGTGFTGATAVAFGGSAATSFTVDSPTQITAVAPAHALGTVDVTVTTAYGTSTASAADQYSYGQLRPTLTTTPSAGTAAGGTLTEAATLSGGAAPTGTIHFDLYGPTDPTCTGPAVSSDDAAATLGSATSAPVTVTTAGTYHWSVHYGGDTLNAPADASCVDATTVTAGPLAHLTTTSGDHQTAIEGHRFAPLQVLATDTYGNPVTTRTPVRYTVISGPAAFPSSTGAVAYTTTDGTASTHQLVAGTAPGAVTIRAAARTPDGHVLTTTFTGTVVPTPWTGPAADGVADTQAGAAQGFHLGLLPTPGNRNTWRVSVTQPPGTPGTIYTGTITVDTGTLTNVTGKQLEPGDTIYVGTDANGHSTATFLFHDYGYLDVLTFTTPDTATTLTLTLSVANRPATAAQLFLGRTGTHPTNGSPLTITRQTP